ncbi:hypothetical protein CHARACLAT_028702 [Characodon lateralis]|uniref:Transducer of regulated CREB activity N-terminal domain-containing protein n=1 Tax=Characodon lateralis TaxID=208331 RepID=A0ABU7DKP7_9TELE|nr:hypothetical protein [Characodon lateralis]
MLNNLSLMTLVRRKILRVRPLSPPTLSAGNHSTTSGRPVRSVKMSATGLGGPGPGPGPATGSGSGASNPRKFSEKIALHTQRQAEETAAFQEVMMDITSTRVSVRRRQEEGSSAEEERPVRGCERLPDNLGLLVRVGLSAQVLLL